jgi:hypothetical protein
MGGGGQWGEGGLIVRAQTWGGRQGMGARAMEG